MELQWRSIILVLDLDLVLDHVAGDFCPGLLCLTGFTYMASLASYLSLASLIILLYCCASIVPLVFLVFFTVIAYLISPAMQLTYFTRVHVKNTG